MPEGPLEDEQVQLLPVEIRRYIELVAWLDTKWHTMMHEYREASERMLRNAKARMEAAKDIPRDGSVDLRAAFIDPADTAIVEQYRRSLRQLSEEKVAVAAQAEEAVESAYQYIKPHYVRLSLDMRRAGELPDDISRVLDSILSSESGEYGHGGGAGAGYSGGPVSQGAAMDEDWQEEERAGAGARAQGAPAPIRRPEAGQLSGMSQMRQAPPVPTPSATGAGTFGWDGQQQAGAGASSYAMPGVVRGPSGGITLPQTAAAAGSSGGAGAGARSGKAGAASTGFVSPTGQAPGEAVHGEDEGQFEGDRSAREHFCVCTPYKGDTDNMIGCESEENCKGGEWFHLECVGLRAVPKGTWYCGSCQQARRTMGKR